MSGAGECWKLRRGTRSWRECRGTFTQRRWRQGSVEPSGFYIQPFGLSISRRNLLTIIISGMCSACLFNSNWCKHSRFYIKYTYVWILSSVALPLRQPMLTTESAHIMYTIYSKIIEYYEQWMNYSCFQLTCSIFQRFNFASGSCTINSSMLLV